MSEEVAVEAMEGRRKKTARPESVAGTELRGVYQLRGGAYGASIWDRSSRTQVWLGTFDTVEDASSAYASAAAKLPRPRARKNAARSSEPDAGTGFRGVYRLPSGAYGASIRDPSSRTWVWLGSFGTVEDAARAYAAAAKLPGPRKRSKLRGVCRTPSGKYGALITHSKPGTGRTQVWLGTFGTAEDAARAYDAAAVRLHRARAITNFGPGSSVLPGSQQHDDLSTAERQQVDKLLKDMDSTDDKEALIEAAAILHQIALAGHEHGGRGQPT